MWQYWLGIKAATWLHLRLYATHPLRITQVILRPFQVGLTLMIVLQLGGRELELGYAVVGAAMVGIWGALLATATFTILRERFFYGTFSLLSGTPTPLMIMFSGFLIGELIISLPALLVGFAVVFAVVGADVLQIGPASFLMTLIVGSICLVATCLCFAPFLALSSSMPRWFNALEYPTWIMGCFIFPIWVLPAWLHPFNYIFAPYWVAESMRLSLGGTQIRDLWVEMVVIVSLTIVQVLVAVWGFAVVNRRARQTGQLTLD